MTNKERWAKVEALVADALAGNVYQGMEHDIQQERLELSLEYVERCKERGKDPASYCCVQDDIDWLIKRTYALQKGQEQFENGWLYMDG